jgi:hypothetical protein
MKAVINRVHRLEVQTNAQRDLELNPRKRFRIVVCRVTTHAASLANAICDRELTESGCLSELVTLDGTRDHISDEELDRFIASFPARPPDRKLRIVPGTLRIDTDMFP